MVLDPFHVKKLFHFILSREIFEVLSQNFYLYLLVNAFLTNAPLLYPQKYQKTFSFLIFRGYRNGKLVENRCLLSGSFPKYSPLP